MADKSNQTFITQAERIIRKFGGAQRLAKLLELTGEPISAPTIYRWTYPRRDGGTNGLIPPDSLIKVLKAARFDGLLLTSQDLDPRPSVVKETV
ncbi:hypothetical protein E6Q11_02435 [Candidatus Dojkabacteria bacterium]|uniref:Uncharacterized protein n=1 Tax=Candidatus Dojkabacteria bacterium TaxID=2099670 RepID=A0A5C7JAP9_9BACT|nr:MAG: hypothetical protein E6Q11_02435 [Candidatus Dojkabacteria bacterium]